MALTWSLKLNDGLSGPAGKAARSSENLAKSLDQTAKAADRTDKAMRKMGSGSGPQLDKMTRRSTTSMSGFGRAVQFVGRHVGSVGVRAMMSAGGAMDKYGDSAKKAIGAIGGVASAAASMAGTFAAIGGGLMIGGAAIGAQVAMHVRSLQAFKESTLFAFTKILGTREEAQRIYDMAAKTSFEVGGDLKTSISGMNALLAKGFKADFADELIRRMADLSTLNPSANIEALIYNIGKIRSQGRLQGDELQALSEAGLNVADVYAEIAKSMKLTAKPGQSIEEQVLALQAAGKIKSDVAIPAIMEAIKKASGGGAAGAVAAEKASKSPEGMMMKLLNLKDQLLSSIVIDWSPITRGIERVMAALQSPAGARLLESIGAAIGGILGKLDKITQADIEGFFEDAAAGIDAFAGAMGALIDLTIALGPLWKVIGGSIVYAFQAMELAAGVVIAGIGMVQGALESLWAFVSAIDMAGIASFLGVGIIDGIVSGITGGHSSVVDAIVSVATSAIDAGKAALGIASPSKVFAGIGANVVAGFSKGVAANENQAVSATTQMSSAATNTGSMAARSISSRTANDNSKQTTIGAINITESKDAKATGREVSAAVMKKAG